VTADDQTRLAARATRLLRSPHRLRRIARAVAARTRRPLRRRSSREAELAAAVSRLDAEVRHLRERHGEQIERLEDMVRELVRTAESLRRVSSRPLDGGGD